MNPEILEYLIREESIEAEFFHYKINNEIKASYFVTGGKDIGLNIWRKFPVSYDEVLIPADPGVKLFLPDRCNKLSVSNRANVLNSTFTLLRKNKICWAKETFSAKNEKARRNELNRFIKNGGEVKSCEDFLPHELAEIYVHLFTLRFSGKVRCYKIENLICFFTRFRHMLFGHVLLMHGKPCAFDMILKSESQQVLYFDVPNGGLDINYLHLSIGSLLMWLNIKSADELCRSLNKKRIFSIGLLESGWEYKKRWANTSYLGKVIF